MQYTWNGIGQHIAASFGNFAGPFKVWGCKGRFLWNCKKVGGTS